MQRPGLDLALERIRNGESGGICVGYWSRLTRGSQSQVWALLDEVDRAGGKVYAPDAPAEFSSPTGELQITLLAAIARWEWRTKKEAFERAKERAIRRGIPIGPVPFGYRQLPDRTLEVDPETAPFVAELYECRADGMGWGALAKMFAERTGHPWTRQALPALLANPIYYTGRLHYGDFVSEHDAGSIVDAALWHAAQRPKVVRDGRSANGKWLLSGLLRCGTCGLSLIPWRPSSKASKGTARRYKCTGAACPQRVSVHADVAEDMVIREAFKLSRRLVTKAAPTVDLAPLEAALEKAQRRFEQVQEPAAMDALGDAWATTAKARREELEAAAAALGEARMHAGVEDVEGQVLQLAQLWDDLDPQQQREALAWHFSEVRASKVPKGEKPDLAYTVAASRPFRIEFRPPVLQRL